MYKSSVNLDCFFNIGDLTTNVGNIDQLFKIASQCIVLSRNRMNVHVINKNLTILQ